MSDNKFIVYVGKHNGECVYVGQGESARYHHLNSGISHVYEANRLHFEGIVIDVYVVATGLSKEDALSEEARLIGTLRPKWNSSLSYHKRLTRRSDTINEALKAIAVENIILRSHQDFLLYVAKRLNKGVCTVTTKDISRDLPDITAQFISTLANTDAYVKLARIVKATLKRPCVYEVEWIRPVINEEEYGCNPRAFKSKIKRLKKKLLTKPDINTKLQEIGN